MPNNFDFQGLNIKKGGLANLALVNLKPFLFADLPTSSAPATIAYITDSDTTVIGDPIAGMGANEVIGIYNTVWTVFGSLEDRYYDIINVVRDFGASADGTSDDTIKIQAALDTGKDVYFPKTSAYYKITAALSPVDGQRIFGGGENSQIRQVTSLANVFTVTSKTSVVFENLNIYAAGDRTSQTDGAGILFSGCTHCKVTHNTFKNCRGGSVTVSNSDDNEVSFNTFLDAATSGATHEVDVGWDIQILNASNRNLVSGNLCISGTGAGIKVQSVNDGEIAEDNIIIGNRIANARNYGILAYRNYNGALPAPQSVNRTIIANNNIDNILGDLLNTATGDYAYGAGIYIQGAEDAVVTGNNINLTHSGGVTFSSSLTPGSIGVTNMSRGTITGNSITNAGVQGIDISNASTGIKQDPDGGLVVGNNTILTTAGRGIRVRISSDISLVNNHIVNTGSSAIEINLPPIATMTHDFVISGNRIKNATGSGINAHYITNAIINDNLVDNAGGGIGVTDAVDVTISDNLLKNYAGTGINIASTVSAATITGNTVIGDGSSTTGITLSAFAMLGSNRVFDNLPDWNGDYAVLRGTAETIAVGNVGAGEDDLMSYVMPAASFLIQGQYVHVRGWGIAANNANAKTLKMYFGSTLIMTISLTVAQLSTWTVDTYILNRSNAADSQRCLVSFRQDGTITQVKELQTDSAETEANAITIKFTGEATADDDIRQFGILTTFANPG